MLSFKNWLKEQTVISNDIEVRTINDILDDNDFPQSVCKFVMLDYLEKNANDVVVDIFNNYYELYINYITQEACPAQ